MSIVQEVQEGPLLGPLERIGVGSVEEVGRLAGGEFGLHLDGIVAGDVQGLDADVGVDLLTGLDELVRYVWGIPALEPEGDGGGDPARRMGRRYAEADEREDER